MTADKSGRSKVTAAKRRRFATMISVLLIVAGVTGLAVCFGVYRSRQAVYEFARDEYSRLQPQQMAASTVAPDEGAQEAQTTAAQADGQSADANHPFQNVDIAALREMNPDCIGWIEIPGTEISYPVVIGSDNEYYVEYTFMKTQNKAGAIFADFRCSGDFSDFHTIVYGHNMRDGSMFAQLKDYCDAAFLQEYSVIYLHRQGEVLVYRVLMARQTSYDDWIYTLTAGADEESVLREELAKALKMTDGLHESGRFLTLSTCTGGIDRDARVIVSAVLEEVLSVR